MLVKILFITTNVNIGGGEAQLVYLVNGLKERNCDVTVALPGHGQLTMAFDRHGIKYVVIPSIRITRKFGLIILPIKGFMGLYKQLKKYKPDVVHILHYEAVKIGGLASKLLNIPTVWTCHGFWIKPRGLGGWIVNKLIDQIVTVSNYAKTGLLQYRFIDPKKIEIINNCVPNNYFKDKNMADEFKDHNNIPKDKIVIGIIGRIEKLKRHDIFIEVINGLIKHKYSVYGLIVGSEQLNDQRENITKEIIDKINLYDLTNNIKLIPFLKNPIPAYDALDILLVTSDGESFSNSIIEAMARCKAVVATACGGPQEIIRDGQNGMLVAVNSPSNMTDKVAWLIDNKDQLKGIGINGRNYVNDRLKLCVMVDKYRNIYNNLSNEHTYHNG